MNSTLVALTICCEMTRILSVRQLLIRLVPTLAVDNAFGVHEAFTMNNSCAEANAYIYDGH